MKKKNYSFRLLFFFKISRKHTCIFHIYLSIYPLKCCIQGFKSQISIMFHLWIFMHDILNETGVSQIDIMVLKYVSELFGVTWLSKMTLPRVFFLIIVNKKSNGKGFSILICTWKGLVSLKCFFPFCAEESDKLIELVATEWFLVAWT